MKNKNFSINDSPSVYINCYNPPMISVSFYFSVAESSWKNFLLSFPNNFSRLFFVLLIYFFFLFLLPKISKPICYNFVPAKTTKRHYHQQTLIDTQALAHRHYIVLSCCCCFGWATSSQHNTKLFEIRFCFNVLPIFYWIYKRILLLALMNNIDERTTVRCVPAVSSRKPTSITLCVHRNLNEWKNTRPCLW